ncbi:OsmC family protein [Deminuibacter soli]|uniref:OsmC family peroxiredoxin n=1 Tax=Deminuibacter soli TaxID=2291815 RepID=A0A3E1NEZ1_9BACT|nr:OsmC family protein [Deminuibacter soli]RFM26348.1 OsmC family peroxiredoxin [Deminuibacter soli]
MHTHQYTAGIEWTGNQGSGTSGYKAYSRNHTIQVPGKPEIPGSSDPAFLGDKTRYNPEEMLLISLSACHMLWYLHECAVAGVVVTAYTDAATGTMQEDANGSGRFTGVILHPKVTVAEGHMTEKALQLHEVAHHKCFIANSVNFPVSHEAVII